MNNSSSGRRFAGRKRNSQETYNKRLAILLGFFTIGIIFTIIVWGIPLLVNLAGFLGNVRQSDQPPAAEDTIPPVAPQFSAPPEATNSATVNLGGSAEPKSKVEVYLNKQLLTIADADEEGQFLIEKVNLEKGENRITAYGLDKAENKSDPSQEIIIDYDTEPPLLEIDQPQNEETVYEQQIEIKGRTETENIRLTVNDHLVLIEREGNFAYPFELAEGSNTIKVVAQDLAGNKTEKELTVIYYR